MSYILEVKNITKKFGNKVALNNISLNLPKGKVLGLVGGNGAGKTTLSEIIAGISKPTLGTIKYNFKYKKTFKEKIGMQFQDSNYPSGLTVKDLISFARNLHKIKISHKELKAILDTFQMGGFYNQKVKSLSGGQRQKINILLSVIHNPEIIILDELTTGLDISARDEIIKFTKKLLKEKNISAILISHHMHEIESLSDKVMILSHGELVIQSTVEEIEKKHTSLEKYMIKLISSRNKQFDETEVKEKKSLFSIRNFINMFKKREEK